MYFFDLGFPVGMACEPGDTVALLRAVVRSLPKQRHNMRSVVYALIVCSFLPGCSAVNRVSATSASVQHRNQAPAPSAYSVTDLGTLPGDSSSLALSINNAGQIVGDSNYRHAFIWQNGVMSALGGLKGGASHARCISDKGEVVGYGRNAEGNYAALLWKNGQIISLDNLKGRNSGASSINNAGEIVGWSETDGWFSPVHAFIITGGKIRDIGNMGGKVGSRFSINHKSQIVGYVNHGFSGFGSQSAFIWEKGRWKDLGKLGGKFTNAEHINDIGQVVGWSEVESTDHPGHVRRAFLWENDTMFDLGTLRGGSSEADGINNQGWIVGTSSGKAFLWSKGRMVDLNTLIPSGSGWQLEQAFAINLSGQIVGRGLIQGHRHAFLLTPTAGRQLTHLSDRSGNRRITMDTR
jgi:probable HAF family extracellular repeat protein